MDAALFEEPEGAGGKGDCVEVGVGGNTADIGVRAFIRDDAVGMVNLRAAGLEEGVVGREGGMPKSRPCIRLVELACALAREDAVAALYRAVVGRAADIEG